MCRQATENRLRSGTKLAHKLRRRLKMRKNSGFTVMELLVVVAIIAIMASIGVPSLISWRQKAQLGSAARDLFGNFQKAKIEATRSNRNCAVSFNSITVDGKTYDYVAYIDDTPFNLKYNTGERVIATGSWSEYPGVSTSGSITFPMNADSKPTIAFAPDGLPKDTVGILQSGSVKLKNQDGKGRLISVSLTGNVKIEMDDD
jgi:prepilin-type N-terminal cleavage/methylation domain-containing protein